MLVVGRRGGGGRGVSLAPRPVSNASRGFSPRRRPLVVFNASAPGGCPQGSMAKKDMSFIKMVANDEDFHREVYEHGQENLLVSALPPCVRSSLMRVLMPGAHSRPQWSTSTPSAGGRA